MNHKLSSFAIIDDDELINIIGGKNSWPYWGNGVYTNGNKVRTDWHQAWRSVVVFHINHGQMDWPISVK